MNEPDLDALAQELKASHGCHTIILYGSRARGTDTPESDIDVVCFRSQGEPDCDARRWQGYWLDAWMYPDAAAEQAANFLQLDGGRVLTQVGSFGSDLLGRVSRLLAEPHTPLTEAERRHRRAWLAKTLARIRRGDAEAWYRRHWMIAELLEIHLNLQKHRFLGFKHAMQTLQRLDPEVYGLFVRLYTSEPSLSQIATLVDKVLELSED